MFLRYKDSDHTILEAVLDLEADLPRASSLTIAYFMAYKDNYIFCCWCQKEGGEA